MSGLRCSIRAPCKVSWRRPVVRGTARCAGWRSTSAVSCSRSTSGRGKKASIRAPAATRGAAIDSTTPGGIANPSCLDIMPSVRIGIDARKLHDFGIGTYIRNLLRHLARLDRQTEFVVLCRPDDCGMVGAFGENFRAVPETVANYSVAEQIRIPLALKRERVTLF